MRSLWGSWTLAVWLVACARPAAPSPHEATSVVPAAELQCRVSNPIENTVKVPFGFYSVPSSRFAELAAAGVTMVGPYYGEPPGEAVLDAAVAHGLKVIYPLGSSELRPEEEARASLEEQVAAVAHHDAIAAWYALPEEMRPWVPAEMDYLAWVREAVRARDRGHRPLLSYQPNHRQRDGLAEASASFDVVTRGLYANYVGVSEQRAWVREGAETIVAATGATQTPWAVLEMFEQPADERLGRIRDWVRHDVYASLIGGTRGVLVFSGWPREGFPAYASYLDAYLQVATELNGTLSLATPLLAGTVGNRAKFEVVEGPREVEISGPGGVKRVRALGTREVHHAGSTWLYIVNSAQMPLRVRTPAGAEACGIRTLVGPPAHGHQLDLRALGVSVLRID